MTNIGGCLLYERPSKFVEQWADAAINGNLRIANGNEIYIPTESILAVLDKLPFPPPNPENPVTAVSRGWAMLLGNISSQSTNTDFQDNMVKPGSLVYLQWNPEGPGESIYHYDNKKGTVSPILFGEKYANAPPASCLAIVNAYQQITGKPEIGRLIVPKAEYERFKSMYERWEGWSWFKDSMVPVDSVEQLYAELKKGQYPKIIVVDPDFVYATRQSLDGMHVVMIVGYEHIQSQINGQISPLDSLLVNYDDTQANIADHIKPGTGVTLRWMFQATREYDPSIQPQP